MMVRCHLILLMTGLMYFFYIRQIGSSLDHYFSSYTGLVLACKMDRESWIFVKYFTPFIHLYLYVLVQYLFFGVGSLKVGCFNFPGSLE